MANAVLAGVNPVHGLYTVLAATPVGALFTSSVYMNIDSTGAIAATAGSMLLLYPAEDRPLALAVLTLLTGVFMLSAGLLKLGFLTRFIANAVLRGFLTGIGVNSLSMTPVALDDVRAELAGVTLEEAQEKAAKALNGDFYNPSEWNI